MDTTCFLHLLIDFAWIGEHRAGSPVAETRPGAPATGGSHPPATARITPDLSGLDKKDETIQHLIDRVRQLETTLESSSQSVPSELGSQMEAIVAQSSAGHFVKSKFYGESHWINVIEPVCACHIVDV